MGRATLMISPQEVTVVMLLSVYSPDNWCDSRLIHIRMATNSISADAAIWSFRSSFVTRLQLGGGKSPKVKYPMQLHGLPWSSERPIFTLFVDTRKINCIISLAEQWMFQVRYSYNHVKNSLFKSCQHSDESRWFLQLVSVFEFRELRNQRTRTDVSAFGSYFWKP